MSKNIGIIVGSLRKNSFSQCVADALIPLFPKENNLHLIPIADLPLYNQDLDIHPETVPPAWTKFRNEIEQCDAFIFITPEHNRSIPAALKNAIDVGSRPPKYNKWNNKPAGIISQSPGAIGGFGANHHLRQVFTCINLLTMQAPEIYLSNITTYIDSSGALSNEKTIEFLQIFVNQFMDWTNQNSKSKH